MYMEEQLTFMRKNSCKISEWKVWVFIPPVKQM